MESSTGIIPGSAAADEVIPELSDEQLDALGDYVNAPNPTTAQWLRLFPAGAGFMGPADPEPASKPEGRPKRPASNELGSMPPMKKAAVACGEGPEPAGPRPDSPVLTPTQVLSKPALQGHNIQQQVGETFNAPAQYFNSGNTYNYWPPQNMLPLAAQQPAPQQPAFAQSLQQHSSPQELQLQQTVMQQVPAPLSGDERMRAEPGTPGFVEYRPAMAQVLGEQEAARKAKQGRGCLRTWPQKKATDSKTSSPSRQQPAVGKYDPVVNLAMEMPDSLGRLREKWPRMDNKERIIIALRSFKSRHEENADIETLMETWNRLCEKLTKRRAVWDRSDAEAVAPEVIEDMRREDRKQAQIQADASAPALSSTDGMADGSTRVMEPQQ